MVFLMLKGHWEIYSLNYFIHTHTQTHPVEMCFSVAEHMHLKQCASLGSHPRLSGPTSRLAHASPAEDGRALDRFQYPADSPDHGVCALPRHTHTRHFATRIAGESIVKLAAGPADSFTVALISAGKNHRGHHFWLWWPFNSVYLAGFLFFPPWR